METTKFESSSEKRPDSQSQSIEENNNNDELVQILAQELETLVVSCNNNDNHDDDKVFDRDLDEQEVVVVEEVCENEVKLAIDEEIQVMEVKDDVFEGENGAENRGEVIERNEVVEDDVSECRGLEEVRSENIGQIDYYDVNVNVNEIEIQNGGDYGWSDDGNDREYVVGDLTDNAAGWGSENAGGDRGRETRSGGDWGSENRAGEWLRENRGDGEWRRENRGRGDWGSENRGEVWESKNGAGEWGGGEGGGRSVNMVVPVDDYDYDHDEDGGLKSFHYPLRPDAEDCSYYIRTGMCKYGSNCKFNHPLKKRNQPTREIRKPREDNNQMERPGQIDCKYYLSTGGCKYGKACKYNHGSRGKTAITPVLEYNFLGLPIRPGEKECPYYMRNGSCKYGSSCRFNHPDPTAVGGNDSHPPTTYGNDGRLPLQKSSQPNLTNMNNMPSWSAPRTPDPPAAFVPMMYSQTQNIPPPNSDWNGYQAPVPAAAHVYPSSERGLPIPPAFFLNNPPSDTNVYTHQQQQQMVGSDYPERPGQPECSYFMKTGDCKYRSGCKFHHPKSRSARTAPSVLSDKGLPLRPDQTICSHYSRYGICKYGPACKYDHPVNYSNSGGEGGYRSDGRSLIQQSV